MSATSTGFSTSDYLLLRKVLPHAHSSARCTGERQGRKKAGRELGGESLKAPHGKSRETSRMKDLKAWALKGSQLLIQSLAQSQPH